MTNYNERLDEILKRYSISADTDFDVSIRYLRTPEETKQAITSLIKELVSEVVGKDEPHKDWCAANRETICICGEVVKNELRANQRQRIDQVIKENFGGRDEQSLLKALEEVE